MTERKYLMFTKVISAKVAAAAAATAFVATAAAASQGVLPSALESVLSSHQSSVGSHSPKSLSAPTNISTGTDIVTSNTNNTSTSIPGQDGLTNGVDKGLSSGNSAHGLCTAYAASTASSGTSGSPSPTRHSNSVAFARLLVAADASTSYVSTGTDAVNITAYCATVTPPTPSVSVNSNTQTGSTDSQSTTTDSQDTAMGTGKMTHGASGLLTLPAAATGNGHSPNAKSSLP